MLIIPLATLEAVSPKGTGFVGFVIPLFLIVVFLLIAAGCFVSVVCLLFPLLRLGALTSFLICMASVTSLLIGSIAGGSISNHVQKNALTQLAQRSQPLIAAIKSYEQKFGHPPDLLAALVPEFIPKVPNTGIGATPDYQYRSLTNSSSYGNNKWVLEVYSPGETLAFSSFIYLPQQDYSALSYGKVIWRIEDWAYWYKG